MTESQRPDSPKASGPAKDAAGAEGNPYSPFFAAWGRWVLRLRFPLLLLTLASTVLFALSARDLRSDTSIEAFLASKSTAFHVLEELRDDFGVDGLMLVIVEGDVFSEPFLRELQALHTEIEGIDIDVPSLGQRRSRPGAETAARAPTGTTTTTDALGDDFGDFGEDAGWGDEEGGSVIDEVTSLVNARQTTWKDGGLVVRGLLDEWPTADNLPALKKNVLSQPTLVGQVVGAEGRHATIVVRTAFMNQSDLQRVYDEVVRIVDSHDREGFHGLVGGAPALQSSLTRLIFSDVGRLAGAGLLLMFLIMAITFRHPLGIFAPVLVVVQAVIWTFGAMALSDVPMTMLSTILPVFVICVGIGDSVHLQSVYRDARRDGLDNHDAIVRALSSTGLPVLFTTLTTCAGLLSFRLASVDAIQQMGTFGAFGVGAALVHSLVFLPILLSFNRTSLLGVREGHPNDLLERVLDTCNGASQPTPVPGQPGQPRQASYRRRNTTLAIAGAVAIAAFVGGSQLRVYHNPVSWIPKHFPIKAAMDTLDAHLGGSADLMLLIEAPEGRTIKDRALMVGLEKLEAHIRAYRDPHVDNVVGNVQSVVDVVRESNRATHHNDQAYYGVPDTQRGVVDMLTMFENAGPDQLRRLATIDMQRTLMVVRAKWMDASSYAPLVAHIQRGVDEYLGGKAVVETGRSSADSFTVRPTGTVLNLLTIIDSLLSDLMRSFGMAFVFITLMMVALLRDWRLGILAMVPNLLPIIAVMGFMGFVGIPIDMNNILLGSIAIGIAVDDTIHFLHQFKSHFRVHHDVEAGIQHAFDHAGRAIVTTSVILVGGFCTFLAAEMANLMRWGLLVALTLLLAVIVDLVFTPALLRAIYRPRLSTETEKGSDHAPNAAVA